MTDRKSSGRPMGVAAYRKGYRYEQKLVRCLFKKGCYAIRSPRSGRTTTNTVYPDVVAICKNVVFLIEVKYRSNESVIYIKKEWADKLIEISDKHGFIPLLCVFTAKARRPRCCLLSRCVGGSYEVIVCNVDKDCNMTVCG